MVHVFISSEPPGATVKVGGRSLGVTPAKFRFRTGILFEVTAELPGFEKGTRRFTVSGRPNQALRFVLKPAK